MEQKGTTFSDFLIQLIFIILFVILLVWLFPTKDWLKENYFGNTYIAEKETTITDETFVNNINNMLEASKNYFGYNVNLPENIDDEVKVTLQELVDNHIMIMPKDSKGNKCDGDSYATIVKTEMGYTIKVDLTCGNVNDYILRTVGCDPFCQNDCTQKCKLEYEYSKKVDGYYTNWGAWSSWSVNKKTSSTTVKVEEKVFTSKICPTGYELNTDKTACIKNSNSTIEIDAIKNYSCPTGYELSDDKTACIKNSSSTIEIDATKNYSCPSGYSLNSNNECQKTVSSSSTIAANINYTCDSGYNLSGNTCYKTNSISSTKSSKKTCMSGYTYIGSNQCKKVSILKSPTASASGSQCSISYEVDCSNSCKTVAKETCIVNAGTSYSYSCPSGYKLSSDKKTCTSTSSKEAKISYTCSNGKLEGSSCVIENSKVEKVDAKISYTCSNGTLKGTKCVIESSNSEKKEVSISYSCVEGTLKESKCIIENSNVETIDYTLKNVTMYRYATRKYVNATISYKWSTSKEDKTLISNGYILTGKTRKNCK